MIINSSGRIAIHTLTISLADGNNVDNLNDPVFGRAKHNPQAEPFVLEFPIPYKISNQWLAGCHAQIGETHQRLIHKNKLTAIEMLVRF